VDLLADSLRVRLDLGEDLEYPEFFKSKVVVRKFDTRIHPSLEFRAFVSRGRLTALSQYEEFYFPLVVQYKDALKAQIASYFELVNPLLTKALGLDSYVVDFAVVSIWKSPDQTKAPLSLRNDVLIVEVNPFHANTSGCLFRWKNDRNQILNGPFEFRILTVPITNPLEYIPAYWLSEIDQFYRKPELPSFLPLVGAFVLCVALIVGGLVYSKR